MNFNPTAIFKKPAISLKLSDYFEIRNPNYKYLQIIPHKSIGEYNSIALASTIAKTYKSIFKRIKREKKKIVFETEFKISFFIDIQKGNAEFIFIVPEKLEKIIKEQVKTIWPRATIQLKPDKVKPFSENIQVYQMSYKKEDPLSLNADQRGTGPLKSILDVIDVMKEDDRVSILFNFLPRNQHGWKVEYDRTRRKIDELKLVDKKQTSPEYIAKSTALMLVKLFADLTKVIDDFTGGSEKRAADTLFAEQFSMLEERKQLKQPTLDKRNLKVVNTQIAIISDSKDADRRKDNAICVSNAFNDMGDEADNELICTRTRIKKLFVEDIQQNLKLSTNSVREAAEFLQIPNRAILTEHALINCINNTETRVPEELQTGVMNIGTSQYRGEPAQAYLSTDFDYRNLTLCIIGPTRAGKTNLICHLSEDAVKADETVIIFDFCGDCDMSDAISEHISKDQVLNIDCSDFEKLQGLGYNEIHPKDSSMFELYKCTKMKAQQLVTFVNSINTDTKLEPQMARYLKAASYVVFINDGPVKDVFNVLENHVKRHEYIDRVPKPQLDNLEEYIGYLNELDAWSKGSKDVEPEVIGTQGSKIQGILNRIDIIKDNAYTELMLKKDCENNIDLTVEMQKPQLICLRMPEIMFSTDEERDTYCTYWLTKILGALQIRYVNVPVEERTKVNLVFDELYQIPNCQSLLKKHINRIAKKTCKLIISCHSLEQIKFIRPELKNANTSYMMISGSDKANYEELKEELAPFELPDVLELPRYHSLNLIKCNEGYAKFETALPPKYFETVNHNEEKEEKKEHSTNKKEAAVTR